MLQTTRRSRLASLSRGIAGFLVSGVVLAQNACVYFAAAGAGVGGVVGAAASSRSTPQTDPVEVRFKASRQLAVSRTSGRADTTYSNVIAVFGKVQRMSGDTVWVSASELRFPAGRMRFSRAEPPTAIVVRGEGTSVRRLHGQLGAALIGAGIGAAVGGAIGLVIMLSAGPPST